MRWAPGSVFLGLAALLFIHGAALAQAPDPAVPHADYADPALWLCRPDVKDDRCKVDLDATVIAPSGRMTRERYVPAKDPKIDCFFVYPTVSNDPGWVSDFSPNADEWDDIKLQFARFGSVCRQYAPLYRQGTLRRLRYPAGGPRPEGDQPPPGVGGYSDVLDAWTWYLAHENHGRGVVLIGHSQGTGMLTKLLAEQIEGHAVHRQLVSAVLLGGLIMVPPDKDVGGTFKSTPLCHDDKRPGCVIAYATFRDRLPPPANARFGKARDGLRAACVNPANLSGGKGEPESYFVTKGFLNGSGGDIPLEWVRPMRPIPTFFVKTPGLVTTECVRSGDYDYLALHVNAVPSDPRTDELGGQIIRHTGVDLSWGLHLMDVDHSIGTLTRIVGRQGEAYLAQRP
jgi:hypothetical protein